MSPLDFDEIFNQANAEKMSIVEKKERNVAMMDHKLKQRQNITDDQFDNMSAKNAPHIVTTSPIHRLIITGAPGSGKGTISAWMSEDFPFKHLATGDILRHEISARTKEGQEASNFVNSGQLVPDELVTRLILKSLNNYTNHHVLFDGYPRTVQQAKDFERATSITAVIELDVPHEEIIRRVQGRWIHEPSGRVYNTDFSPPKVPGKDDVTGEDLVQRTDDKPEVVKRRLKDYDKRNKAILDYLRPRVLIKTFSGKTFKEIYANIKPFLEKTIFKE